MHIITTALYVSVSAEAGSVETNHRSFLCLVPRLQHSLSQVGIDIFFIAQIAVCLSLVININAMLEGEKGSHLYLIKQTRDFPQLLELCFGHVLIRSVTKSQSPSLLVEAG